MKIKDLFLKSIDRRINGVIKVGQHQEEDKRQELEEYVVTAELKKHFQRFFANYDQSLDQPMEDMGVWISGFFGSGKSHFLKILSYILDEPEVDGKKAMDYLTEKETIASDPTLLHNMQRAAAAPTLTVLFNVDSKSTSTAKSDSNAIVTVFNRVFNERLGYEGSIPLLAELERTLDEEGKFQLFQDTYEKVNGTKWLDDRRKFRVHRGRVGKALVAMGYMDEDQAKNWTKEASTKNEQIALSDFAEQVRRYIERTGKRVVFLVDEIGQFISTDSRLMLNLQTLTEELGTKCQGKAWVIVTAQEAIDAMTANIDNAQERKNDFSKIQGRFHTRLSLSSVNADEVIRERILKKTPDGAASLRRLYNAEETTIQNVVDFKDTPHEMKKYRDADDFVAVYPFLPYQFYLLADILTSIRKNSSSGRSLSSGERSILGAFQQAAVRVSQSEEGALVPLYRFYDNIDQVIDHTHKIVIERAIQNPKVNPDGDPDCFAVNVLKVLFLLKYVEGVPLTENNLVNFMVTQIHEDKAELRRRVGEALQILIRSLYVAQKQDTYTFLTDDEQDMDRAIRSRNISLADTITELSSLVYNDIYPVSRYKARKGKGQYTFGFNKAMDNRPFSAQQHNAMGLRILTPFYDEANLDPLSISMLSSRNNEAILVLPPHRDDYYKEMQQALQIEDYLRKVADPQQGKSTLLRGVKQTEATQRREVAKQELRDALGAAEVYVNGSAVSTIKTHDPKFRIDAALESLMGSMYYHLKDITAPKDEQDLRELFQQKPESGELFSVKEAGPEANKNALREVKMKVDERTRVYETISLKSLLDLFTAAPYGYSENDTKWLVAKLFMNGDLAASIDKEPINRYAVAPEELLSYFTGRRNEERLLFRVKATIKPQELRNARDIMREFFNHREGEDDTDKLMTRMKDCAKSLLNQIDSKLSLYALHPQFPGKKALDAVRRQWEELLAVGRPETFFKKLSEKYDDLMDLAEDLSPVRAFLDNPNQQQIFITCGLDPLHLYKANRDHLLDAPDVKDLAQQIQAIVSQPAPYRHIKELPALKDAFNQSYMVVLDKVSQDVQEAMDLDEKALQEALTGKDYADRYLPKIRQTYADFKAQVAAENNISHILGYKDKSASRSQYFQEVFDREDEAVARRQAAKSSPKGGQTVATPTPPRKTVRTVQARELDPRSTVIIRSQSDIDAYLARLRQKLEAALQDADEVRLRY